MINADVKTMTTTKTFVETQKTLVFVPYNSNLSSYNINNVSAKSLYKKVV